MSVNVYSQFAQKVIDRLGHVVAEAAGYIWYHEALGVWYITNAGHAYLEREQAAVKSEKESEDSNPAEGQKD